MQNVSYCVDNITPSLIIRPKKHPLFLVDLVLDQTGVHYCTPLEKFETSIIDLFDKGILSTYNIPQLDKVQWNLLSHVCICVIYIMLWV